MVSASNKINRPPQIASGDCLACNPVIYKDANIYLPDAYPEGNYYHRNSQ